MIARARPALLAACAVGAGCGARSDLGPEETFDGALVVSTFHIDCFPTDGGSRIDHLDFAATLQVRAHGSPVGPFDIGPLELDDIDRRITGSFALVPSTLPALDRYEISTLDVADEDLTFEVSGLDAPITACELCPFTRRVFDLRLTIADRASDASVKVRADGVELGCSS